MSPYRRRPPPASHVCGLFLLPEIIGGRAGSALTCATHRYARRPRCVSAPAVAAASPTLGFPPRTLAPGRDVFGWLLAPRFVREVPRGQQMGEPQLVGQVQQRHLVPEMGPRLALIPTPYGVGIGPETASDLRPRQTRLLLEQLQPPREVGGHDVDYSAVVNSLSRHSPVLPQNGNPRRDGVPTASSLPQSVQPGALGRPRLHFAAGRRPPPLHPCVRAFFVALYRPRPLTVSADSSGNSLPSLVQTAP